MNSKADNRGFSRIEVLCIVGIVAVGIAVLGAIGWNMLVLMQRGNDANTMYTAEETAWASAPNACLVDGCPGGDSPQHAGHVDASGAVVAYYSKATKVFAETAPAGYNEGDLLQVDGQEQPVPRAAYVVKAEVRGTEVQCTWVLSSKAEMQ